VSRGINVEGEKFCQAYVENYLKNRPEISRNYFLIFDYQFNLEVLRLSKYFTFSKGLNFNYERKIQSVFSIIIKPINALISQIYFGMKIYIFRIIRLPIIRSLFTVHSAIVYVIQICKQLSSRSILVLFENCPVDGQTNSPKHVDFHAKINL
jgi:hypothetical protein